MHAKKRSEISLTSIPKLFCSLIFCRILKNAGPFISLLCLLLLSPLTYAADTDGDGLDDSVETNTGVYVDITDTGTDPNDADTDKDTIPDGF